MIYNVLKYNIEYFRIGKKNTPLRRCLRKREKPIPESFGIAAQAIKKRGKYAARIARGKSHRSKWTIPPARAA